MKLKQWIWHNKEGAIIGGIIGLVGMSYLMSHKLIDLDLLTFKELIYNSESGIIRCVLVYISTLIGAAIGAFIDSLWRKNK